MKIEFDSCKDAMNLKTSDGRAVALPTPEEERVIFEAALTDLDALPLTDQDIVEIEKQLHENRAFKAGSK